MSAEKSKNPAALQIRGLTKDYPGLRALDGVDLDVEQGEYFALLGPNGAGKSTLISIVAGLARASSGSVSVLGNDSVRQWRAARMNLGIVPQELVYDPFFNVRELLRIQAGYFGCGSESFAWVDELLERLDLSDKADTNLRKLSGGMKRRVLIAQALVHKPPLVILDEPTAGVDVELRRALWSFTRDLHREGTTIVLTTHYLEEAQELCDKLAVLNKGRIIAAERTDDFIRRHPWFYLDLSIENVPEDEKALPELLRETLQSRDGDRLALRLEQGVHAVGDVLDALRSANLRVTDVRTREASLEDVFVALTGGEQPAQPSGARP